MHDEGIAALDQYVAPGMRLWMLIGLVSGVLLIMVVIVCCFIKIRIPRTKRQIELIAAQRKMRKAQAANPPIGGAYPEHDNVEHRQTIVMNSLSRPIQGTTVIKKENFQPSRSIPV
ncbi:TMIE protein [Ditylenchus destructor]|nr:TMIE protein [Ditylenchus destructor]